MHYFKYVFCVMAVISTLTGGFAVAAEHNQGIKQGPYLVVEGNVSQVTARMLVIDGQQYPVSMYVRVFLANKKNEEIPMHTVVNVGKIDKARLFILGGKVQKIVVLKNL